MSVQALEQPELQEAKGELIAAVELILGADVYGLEDRLAAYLGTNHCVAVSDGATGIAMALAAAGLRQGDGVLCAALGCALPVQGISMAGCLPIFVDVNPNTYNIDSYCVEYALGKRKRMGEPPPRALIATDLFGAPCDYPALEELCDRKGLALIEDLTGAFGARLDGVMAGRFGQFSVASFATPGPLEELGGGAVFCRDEWDARQLRALRRTGRQERLTGGEGFAPEMGFADVALINARLGDCAAQLERKHRAAADYDAALEGRLRTQQIIPGGESAYSQMVVILPPEADRTTVAAQLREWNIPSAAPLCGIQQTSNDWNRVMLPNTRAVAGRLLSLPIHPHLGSHLVEYICRRLFEAVGLGK